MRTPFGLLEPYVSLSPQAVRRATTFALLCSIGIILTGGIVRLTGSGLGCPTWPKCTEDSLIAPETSGIHGAIEFTNRLLTFVIVAAIGLAIIAARLQKVPNRWLVRTTWSQFYIIVLNAILGGITVWTGLNPYLVALHFCAATLLLTTTTLSYDYAHSPAFDRWNSAFSAVPDGQGTRYRRAAALMEQDKSDRASILSRLPADPTRPVRTTLAWILLIAGGLLVVAGTLTTGAGPHPGDSSEVHRIDLDWAGLAWTHGLLGLLVLILAVACTWAARQAGDRKTLQRGLVLIGLLIAQALLGVYQSLDGLPWVAVAVHLLGAALVWTGLVRVLLATIHPDPVAVEPESETSAPANA